MSMFKRVFNTPAKSEPVLPVEPDTSELDETLEGGFLSDIVQQGASGETVAHTTPEISPIPRDQDFTLTGAEDLRHTPHAPAFAPEPEPGAWTANDDDRAEREAEAEREIAAFQARIAAKQQRIEEARQEAAASPLVLTDPVEPAVSRPAAFERPRVTSRSISWAEQEGGLHLAPPPDAVTPEPVSRPVSEADQAARPGRSARRVRTRMLGFDQGVDAAVDPFEKAASQSSIGARKFPVGWIVVADGPGKGHSFTLYNGVSTIGRGEDQTVVLDLGDTSISREKHASIAYDCETNGFYLGHGGKSNIVRLNDRPVLSTEDLRHSDTIRIGETTLRFIALCCDEFTWGAADHAQSD